MAFVFAFGLGLAGQVHAGQYTDKRKFAKELKEAKKYGGPNAIPKPKKKKKKIIIVTE
jgi:hypothetical protein